MAYFLICQKYLKGFYTNTLIVSWKKNFPPYLCGFGKNHNVQYSLLKRIKKRNKQLNTSEKIGLIFMDLSKAIDTINLSSLAKLKAYGFSEQAKFTTNSSR